MWRRLTLLRPNRYTAAMLQMPKIFIGLVFWNLVLFGVTVWLGVTHRSAHWQHQALGVVTGIYTCLTHSIVLMHFMGSGKAIKEAVQAHALPDDPKTGYSRQTRKFKARTSGLATLGCLLAIVVVCLGGWADTHKVNLKAYHWHVWCAYGIIIFNLYAFWVEYRVITENTALIREVDSQIPST